MTIANIDIPADWTAWVVIALVAPSAVLIALAVFAWFKSPSAPTNSAARPSEENPDADERKST